MALRKSVLQVFKGAARQWLFEINRRVPVDSGFLLGAFQPLADYLGVTLQGRAGALFAETVQHHGSKKGFQLGNPLGLLKAKHELFQARLERGKRLAALRRQKAQNIRHRERNNEGAHAEGLTREEDGLNRRERLIEENVAHYQQRKQRATNRTNIRRVKALNTKIAALRSKLTALRAKQIDYRNEKINIYGYRVRDKYETVRIPTNYTQKERLEAIRKKIKLPLFTESRQYVSANSPGALINKYRKYYYPARGVRGPLKTPSSGRRYSTELADIFQEVALDPELIKGSAYAEFGQEGRNVTVENLSGRAIQDPAKATFRFTFNVDINYYRIMDLRRKYSGTPWLSQAYAQQVFVAYLRQYMRERIPSMTNFLIKTVGFVKKDSITGVGGAASSIRQNFAAQNEPQDAAGRANSRERFHFGS